MTLSEQLAAYHADSPFSSYDEKTGTGLERGAPTMAELAVPYVAPGRPAEIPIGVIYRADHETLDDGMCRQARTHARAIADAGVPLALRTLGNRVRHGNQQYVAADDMLAPPVWKEVGKLRQAVLQKTALVIIHAVITSPRHFWRILVPDYLQHDEKAVTAALNASILYTPWERDRVGPDLIGIFSRLGELWLQCQRNVDAFVASGMPREKIRIVPNAYDPTASVFRVPLRPPAKGKRFYNIGKWEPRKDQDSLIGAFLHAYGPTDQATLFVKTFDYRPWLNYPSTKESVGLWLAHPGVKARGWTKENVGRHVIINERLFTEDEIAKLHHLSNIYVSSSHAEGWDYPAFDAIACGNRLVHVGFGGSEDYARREGEPYGPDVRVPFELGPVHPAYQWERDASWASYAFADLVHALEVAEPLPVRAAPSRLRMYSREEVGKWMRRGISELARRSAPELLEALQ